LLATTKEWEGNMGDLTGKVAFITGVARGQGRAHAVRLAEDGADIIGVDIVEDIKTAYYPMSSPADLEETVRLVESLGRRMVARKADVRVQSELDAAVAEGVDALGPIGIVCANAGMAASAKTWEITDEQWQNVIDVNLTGVWRTIKATVPGMIETNQGGSIILTSSLAGLKGYSNIANYVASKHGVNGLMRVLANELGPYNIRVNSVCPGLINTPLMMNDYHYALFRPELENPTQADATQVFRTMQALPIDWLEPRDVANVIAFLASDDAAHLTGMAVPVDAGQIGLG
jgi:(+)-trans-carveol dehydrogenase